MSPLTTTLNDVALRLYPEAQLSAKARFLPMFDLDKGEISSTAAIEIARALRGDAMAIAQRLIEELSPRFGGTWKVVAGYIVLSDVSSELILQEVRTGEAALLKRISERPRSVFCLTPDSITPVYARMRLLASSALQAFLTVAIEGRCRVGFEPSPPQEVSSLGAVVTLFREAVERALASDSEVRRTAIATHLMEEQVVVAPTTIVWTSHHYHEQLPKEVKRFFSDARRDGWLLSRDRALSEILSPGSIERVVGRLSTQEAWTRWLFHMASATPSGDLDPSVALYDECASPRWSLQVLHDRLVALASSVMKIPRAELLDRVGDSLSEDRILALRALFLPMLTSRVIEDGEVLGWISTVEKFAARAHARLNAPHFRAELSKSPLSRDNVQIIASLVFGITSILPVVTEDVCAKQQQNSNHRDLT